MGTAGLCVVTGGMTGRLRKGYVIGGRFYIEVGTTNVRILPPPPPKPIEEKEIDRFGFIYCRRCREDVRVANPGLHGISENPVFCPICGTKYLGHRSSYHM